MSEAAFIVGERNGPAEIAKFGNAVTHDHGEAGEFEHVVIVPIVADGHDFFTGDAEAANPFFQSGAFRDASGIDVENGEIFLLVFGDADGIFVGDGRGGQEIFDGAHAFKAASEHDLNGIFGKRAFERRDPEKEFPIAIVVGATIGIFEIDVLVDDLAFLSAIEEQRAAGAVGSGGGEDLAGDFSVEKMAEMGFTVHGFDESAIAANEEDAFGQRGGDGKSEVEAAAGDQDDLDAAVQGFDDGEAVGFGNAPVGVEKGAVDVDGDELYRLGGCGGIGGGLW